MLSLVVPDQKEKIEKQIYALEWQLKQEITEKDREIFNESLTILKEKLKNKMD